MYIKYSPIIAVGKQNMDSIHQAAILLLGMGEQQASKVLQHMSPKQVEKLVLAMNEMQHISQDDIDNAAKQFLDSSQGETNLGLDTQDFIRSTLVSALGDEKATAIIDRSIVTTDDTGVQRLKWQDASAVASVICDEHPQVIAVILTYLDSEQAAQVLDSFSEEERLDLMKRLAKLKSISPVAMQELDKIMQEGTQTLRSFKTLPLSGTKLAANIMNFMGGETSSSVMQGLSEFDQALGEELEGLIFPFEKLAGLDSRSLQTLLRDVPTDTLVLALKAADDKLCQTFFSNMSERASAMLKDDLEAKGPVQLSKVISAQKEVVSIAQSKAKEGDIVISGQGETMV